MDGQSFKDAIELIEFMIGEGTDYWLRNANSKMRWMKKQRLSQEQRDQLKRLQKLESDPYNQ